MPGSFPINYCVFNKQNFFYSKLLYTQIKSWSNLNYVDYALFTLKNKTLCYVH